MTSTPVLPPSDVPTIKLRSPGDLVAATPYLLGFHPTDSVVVAAFRGSRVVFAARSDLPGPDTPPPPRMAREVVELAARQGPDGVAILGYGPAARVDELLRPVREEAERRGFAVKELLRVADGRWWSYLCENPECCPPEGTPFDPAASEVAARCTVEGLAAAASRSELARAVAPVDGADRAAVDDATDRAELQLQQWLAGLPEGERLDAITTRGTAAVRGAIERYGGGGRLDDDELALLSIMLVSIPVRDAAWRAITTVEPHLRLWTDVTQRADPALVPAPASLLAFTAWRAGDGALARLALERALHEDPSYSMATLLLDGLTRGVPPSALDGWGSPEWEARLDREPPAERQPTPRSRKARARRRRRRNNRRSDQGNGQGGHQGSDQSMDRGGEQSKG